MCNFLTPAERIGMEFFNTRSSAALPSPSFDHFVQLCGARSSEKVVAKLHAMLRHPSIRQNLDAISPIVGQTPLTHACQAGNSRLVSYLLQQGADPYAPNRQGQTPLTLAQQPAVQAALSPYVAPLAIKMAMR